MASLAGEIYLCRVIRFQVRSVEGAMHEATDHTYEPRRRAVPLRRRLGVVSEESQLPPAADELAGFIAAVAARGDREAFAALFKHFGPRLKTFFMRGGMSSAVAEDIVQEAMLAVWRKASYFDPARAGAATWVFTIARNLRIDYLRRQRSPNELPSEPEELPPSLEEALMGAERESRVREALALLSTEQQTIIRLSYYSERSQSEIAEELKIPLGTVKSRTRLAMNRLRAILEDDA
ncbi:sigma-70 family RNA polymerase sigma factor [Mesorhizobium australicum]|uniref:RNA polymerase sigma-70 factor, ECF subfamily n=1 Tax=Mesorhizobium australicum TaxID=536018 RepID=A0A1X7P9W3_9HYPH|nr:sigma-70 family RNA polymerase sigma factor [Mesorhizobium australicum]SMH47262.1 RNA polymerase sigma-70 factor, ECF subfamily [Mesorhizobium australicum]